MIMTCRKWWYGKIDLWNALDRSDVAGIKFALESSNPDLTEIRGGINIFHEAACQQKADALKILIQAAIKSNQTFLLTQESSRSYKGTPLQYACIFQRSNADCAIALLEAGVSLSDCLRINSFESLKQLLKYAKLQKEAALDREQQVKPFLLPFLHRDLLSIITDYESSYNEKEWFDAMHFVPKDQSIVLFHWSDVSAIAQIAYRGVVELMNLALTVIGDVDFPMNGLLKTKEPASLYELTLYQKKHIRILRLESESISKAMIKLIESKSKKKQESEERVNSNIQAYKVLQT